MQFEQPLNTMVRSSTAARHSGIVDCIWNVMAHAQKPDFFFRRNWRVHLNRQGRQFSRLLVAEVCASAVVMLDKPCSEVVWRVLATHSFRQFPLHFPSRASPCAITFQLDSVSTPAALQRIKVFFQRLKYLTKKFGYTLIPRTSRGLEVLVTACWTKPRSTNFLMVNIGPPPPLQKN